MEGAAERINAEAECQDADQAQQQQQDSGSERACVLVPSKDIEVRLLPQQDGTLNFPTDPDDTGSKKCITFNQFLNFVKNGNWTRDLGKRVDGFAELHKIAASVEDKRVTVGSICAIVTASPGKDDPTKLDMDAPLSEMDEALDFLALNQINKQIEMILKGAEVLAWATRIVLANDETDYAWPDLKPGQAFIHLRVAYKRPICREDDDDDAVATDKSSVSVAVDPEEKIAGPSSVLVTAPAAIDNA